MSRELDDDDSKILSMEDIEASDDVEYAKIEGFKPGEVFRIGSLSAGDMIEWTKANEGEAKYTAGLRLICKSLVDANGKRIALSPKNIEIFRAKSHKVTERIVRQILKHNGMKVQGLDLD
jgi:hypothetical protein